MRPKWSLSGNTSAWYGRLAPPESTSATYTIGDNERMTHDLGLTQVHARQVVFLRDFLRSHVLLHGDGIVGASLDRCIVCHDHARLSEKEEGEEEDRLVIWASFREDGTASHSPVNGADSRDDASGTNEFLSVQLLARQCRQFEEWRALVGERSNAFSRKHLAPFSMALHVLLATACTRTSLSQQQSQMYGHRRKSLTIHGEAETRQVIVLESQVDRSVVLPKIVNVILVHSEWGTW